MSKIVKLSQNKVLRNFSFLTVTNIFVQLLAVLTSIRLARQLQPSGYGLLNLILTQSSMFSIIAVYGLRIVIVRHIARKKEDAQKIFLISNHIRLVTSLVAILIAILYNNFDKEKTLSSDFLFALSMIIIFQTLWDTIESISFGFERMEASGIINLIFALIWLMEVYLIPIQLFKVNALLFITVFNQTLRTIIYFLWLNKYILKFSKKVQNVTIVDYSTFIKQGNYYFILAIFTAIQNQVPILLLQFNSTLAQLGIFNLGYRILSPLQMVLNMLLTSLFPMLSRLATFDRELFSKRIKNLLNIITLIGIWGCLNFSLFSNDVVVGLYGNQYSESGKVILIQCWYNIQYALFCSIGTVLSALDKQKWLAVLSIIAGIVGFPVFYFGSKHGAIGLATAFIVAGFINMTYLWLVLKKTLAPYITWKYTLTVFTPLVLLTIGSLLVAIDWNIIAKLILAFGVTVVIFGYVIKVEYKRIIVV